jgi:hypothetical protein
MENTRKHSMVWPAKPTENATAATGKPGKPIPDGSHADTTTGFERRVAAIRGLSRADVTPEWLEMFAELRI